jgi:hypothetical protein
MGGKGGKGGISGMGMGGGQKNKRQSKDDKGQKKDKSETPAPPKEDDLDRRDLVPTAGAVFQARHWICVTGLVPVAPQSTEYNKVFQFAAHKSDELDEPVYAGIEVERAIVSTLDQAVDEWEKLDMDSLVNDMETWLEYRVRFVDDRYLDPAFSWDVPPLVSDNHEPDQVRHPRIPPPSQTAAKEAEPSGANAGRGRSGGGGMGGPGSGGKGMGQGGMGSGGIGSGGMGSPGGMGQGMGPGGMGRGGAGMGGPGGMGPGGMGPGGMGPGGMGPGGMGNRDTIGRDAMGRGTAGRGASGRSGAGGVGMARTARRNLVDNKMFRFFDTTVEAGKMYRYRVRLKLKNPNYGLRPEFLEKGHPELANDELKDSPWSEASPGIFVPPAGSLLASDILPPTGAKESMAKVMVKTLDAEKGIEAVKVFEMRRGSLANQEGVETLVSDYSLNGGSKTETIDFETDATCLDMVGGEKLPMGGKAPGRVMMVRANGELAVLDQFADAASVDREQRQLDRMNKNNRPTAGPDKVKGDVGKNDVWNTGIGDEDGRTRRKRK